MQSRKNEGRPGRRRRPRGPLRVPDGPGCKGDGCTKKRKMSLLVMCCHRSTHTCSRTHTRTNTHARTRTHTRTHTQTHTHTQCRFQISPTPAHVLRDGRNGEHRRHAHAAQQSGQGAGDHTQVWGAMRGTRVNEGVGKRPRGSAGYVVE